VRLSNHTEVVVAPKPRSIPPNLNSKTKKAAQLRVLRVVDLNTAPVCNIFTMNTILEFTNMFSR
jgi:hypothetical protein